MADVIPPDFYNRADALIEVANQQCSQAERDVVSTSFLYAAARFNCWISAANSKSQDEFIQNREKVLEFFTHQYRAMLEEHIEDYVENYAVYLNQKN